MNNTNGKAPLFPVEPDDSTSILHLARLSDFIFALAMALMIIAF